MAWARLDDRYDDGRKVRRAWRRDRAAVGVHVMAITYCSRHGTDGLVDLDWLEECLPVAKERVATLALLVEIGLFHRLEAEETMVVVDGDGNEIVLGPCVDLAFVVHDFLEFNPSSVQSEDRRRRERVRKASERSPNSVREDTERTENRVRADTERRPRARAQTRAGSGRVGTGRETGSQGAEGGETNSQGEGAVGAQANEVEDLFAYWQQQCGHPEAKLSQDRRGKIRARLAEGRTVEEVRKGIDGAANAAHVNDAGQRFDDIELICRSGSKLESFIGRAELRRERRASSERLVQVAPASEAEVERWAEVAQRLYGEVDEASFRQWLEPLHPHGSPNGRLVLGASAAGASWVRERFGSMLERAAGGPVEIVACGCEPAGEKAA